MPLQETSGNVTTDAYGGGAAAKPNYIEDVFSTYLYTGNGSTQTITNGIDLAGKGGMVWIKSRNNPVGNQVFDTIRGVNNRLETNTTAAQGNYSVLPSFNSNGFTVDGSTYSITNFSAYTYSSWTFRKQPKFFDVVTYTGTGAAQTIAHSLGSTPGCVIVKCTSSAASWRVWHSGMSAGYYAYLNATNAQLNTSNQYTFGNDTTYVDPTSTNISVGTLLSGAGETYVAYVFAHNAGGFGLTGTDNVISCGSFTTDSNSQATVNLGYEPQWVVTKAVSTAGDWNLTDNMRGMPVGGNDLRLFPNSNVAENNGYNTIDISATGFTTTVGSAGATHIYIAIRRGPMKVPTSGTSVFSPALYTGTGSTNTITSPFPSDLLLVPNRAGQFYSPSLWDRLRGATKFLRSPGTDAEATSTDGLTSFGADQNSVAVGADATYGNINFSGRNYVPYFFRRAPSFFDEVCYTGDSSSNRALNHNLGVTPELIICRSRSNAQSWITYTAPTGLGAYLLLQNTGSINSNADAFPAVSSTTFTPTTGTAFGLNDSGKTYVAYLFATCAGVSKVGSYTGNGSTQTINCGFTGGARFVLIKRTDAAGDWYVYDTARGMTTLTDPYLLLNSTAAESATLGSVTTVTTGFAVNASILAAINTNAASYIFLAIA